MAVGSAIRIHLEFLDAGRTQVEEAQLARAVLRRIADDLRGVPLVLQEVRDRRRPVRHPVGRAWHADRQQPRAEGVLASDEGCPTGGAALLAVGIGKAHALVGNAVDIGSLNNRLPGLTALNFSITTGVFSPIISKSKKDIWFFGKFFFLGASCCN